MHGDAERERGLNAVPTNAHYSPRTLRGLTLCAAEHSATEMAGRSGAQRDRDCRNLLQRRKKLSGEK